MYLNGAPPTPTVADIAYGPDPAQRLDVWRPQGKGPFPIVLTVHGGAFLFGGKRGHDGLKQDIAALLSNGIAVASTNYRMWGEARFPAAAGDVTTAIAALRRKARLLDIDPGRVALWGKSTGANLALLAGLSEGRALIGAERIEPVAAIVAMYPPVRFDAMDDQLRNSPCGTKAATHGAGDSPESMWLGSPVSKREDLVAAASPISYVSASSPPVLLQAGGADCTVPHEQSEMLADALRKVGGKVHLDIVPDAQHIDPVFDKPGNLANVVRFL
ncbi:alpha/beta hydrolase [Sphingomonas oryzagri]|nr:alpha/beta hydrolase [Sphingomonas oryzagri]